MISKEKLLNGFIDNVYNKINKTISNQCGVPVEDIKPSTELKADIGMDSLDDVELVMALEEVFDIAITDIEAERCVTVRDIYKGISRKLGIEYEECPPINVVPSAKGQEIKIENCTFTSSDIFQQMLVLSQQHNVLIQFDGLAEEVVVTCQVSDKEYTVTNKQHFDSLIDSLKTLSKFERS